MKALLPAILFGIFLLGPDRARADVPPPDVVDDTTQPDTTQTDVVTTPKASSDDCSGGAVGPGLGAGLAGLVSLSGLAGLRRRR